MQFLIRLRKTSCAQHRYKYSVRCLYGKSGGAGHGTVALNVFIHCESFEYSYNIIYVVSNPTWKSCCSLLLIQFIFSGGVAESKPLNQKSLLFRYSSRAESCVYVYVCETLRFLKYTTCDSRFKSGSLDFSDTTLNRPLPFQD